MNELSDAPESTVSDVFGESVERQEDPERLQGDAAYTDDLRVPGMALLAILRSPHAHATIEEIDTSAAEALDGVHAVFTGEDLAESDAPGVILPLFDGPDQRTPAYPILAQGKVRYEGDPVAVAVAEDRYTAADARDLIEVEYDRHDAVTDPAGAVTKDAPPVHDDVPDNVCIEREYGDADEVASTFEEAPHTVSVDLTNPRVAAMATEPRAAIAEFRPRSGKLDVTMPSQNPHLHKSLMADTLGLSEDDIDVEAPNVGGGFGSKAHQYPEESITAWCAMQLERPVKWQATRTEHFVSTAHGRGDHRTEAELAFDDDGRIQGMRVRTHAALGAYLSRWSVRYPANLYPSLLAGAYDVPTFHAKVTAAFTHTPQVSAYSGAGMPQAIYVVERLTDLAARELGMDPAEFRRRNFVPSEEFPYQTATGFVYDSGDYPKALDLALETVDYEDWKERQAELREEGRYLGIGVASYVGVGGIGPSKYWAKQDIDKGIWESVNVRVEPSGTVRAYTGLSDQGQGHETTLAQILASKLGVDLDDVEIVEGDTRDRPEGTGTWGNRSAVIGGMAMVNAADEILEKAERIAAHQFETTPEDVVFEDGEFYDPDEPDRSLTVQEVANEAYGAGPRIPDDLEPGLEATSYYDPDGVTNEFGTHVAVVEVDPDSGEVEFERYVGVDDCGTRINPQIVDGQIHGGIAQGIGEALYEHVAFDDDGNVVTGSLEDYAVPTANMVPELELDETVTPSPRNPLGMKGVGDSGSFPSPPAVVNAVVDALEPFGVEHLDMPITPETILDAVADRDPEA